MKTWQKAVIVPTTLLVSTIAAKAQALPDSFKAFFGKKIDNISLNISDGSSLSINTNKEVYYKETSLDTVKLDMKLSYFPGDGSKNIVQFPGIPGDFYLIYDQDQKRIYFNSVDAENPVRFMDIKDGQAFVYALKGQHDVGTGPHVWMGYLDIFSMPKSGNSDAYYDIQAHLISTTMNLSNLSLPVADSHANLSVSGLENAKQFRLVSHPSTVLHNIERHDASVARDTLMPQFLTIEPVSADTGQIKVKDIDNREIYSTGVSEIIYSMQAYYPRMSWPDGWHNGSRQGKPNRGVWYLVGEPPYVKDADGNWRYIGVTGGNTADHLPGFWFDQPDSSTFLMTFKKADGQSPDQAFPIDLHVALLYPKNDSVLFNGNSTNLYYNDASLEIFHHQDPTISDTALVTYGLNPYFTVTWSSSLVVGVDDSPKEQVKTPEIKAYPNPVHDMITFRREDASKEEIIVIRDLMGNTVYKHRSPAGESEGQVPLKDLPAGLYNFIVLSTDGRRLHYEKFIKE